MFGPNYDLAVIGGGIHGSGVARDAAGRGLSVFLCEQGDLASGTSSASTKLVHGDLPALERLHFRAVRQALAERAVLLRSAPHIVRPFRFVLSYGRSLRPRFLRRLGVALYDRLGRLPLPPARMVHLGEDAEGNPLRRGRGTAFEFSDCIVDDSRLAVLNAVDARIRGASINPRLRCVIAERDGKTWRLALELNETGERRTVTARALVNAAGPWVGDVLRHVIDVDKAPGIRLCQGQPCGAPADPGSRGSLCVQKCRRAHCPCHSLRGRFHPARRDRRRFRRQPGRRSRRRCRDRFSDRGGEGFLPRADFGERNRMGVFGGASGSGRWLSLHEDARHPSFRRGQPAGAR